MGKVILIILLVVAAVFWLRHKALAQRARRGTGAAGGAARGQADGSSGDGANTAGSAKGAPNARSQSSGGAADTLRGENMVACVRCSVNVPQREAVQGASGRQYCGAEHRALAKDEVR